MSAKKYLSLDYGSSRIGIALGDDQIKIAVPQETITSDNESIGKIAKLAKLEGVEKIVVGYPRNQSGEPTKQTAEVEAFVQKLRQAFPEVVFQDESVTSVLAEERLKSYGKIYDKADIDAMAAVIILEDFLENL
ncbi:MAG: Holliday junction resolvase RuvX [Candidatus Nanosyncoccaceae bacterium]|jgi:putative Holliday junction resolvase